MAGKLTRAQKQLISICAHSGIKLGSKSEQELLTLQKMGLVFINSGRYFATPAGNVALAAARKPKFNKEKSNA